MILFSFKEFGKNFDGLGKKDCMTLSLVLDPVCILGPDGFFGPNGNLQDILLINACYSRCACFIFCLSSHVIDVMELSISIPWICSMASVRDSEYLSIYLSLSQSG